jgi:hypothetical protein
MMSVREGSPKGIDRLLFILRTFGLSSPAPVLRCVVSMAMMTQVHAAITLYGQVDEAGTTVQLHGAALQ